jgi:hypothetical protein
LGIQLQGPFDIDRGSREVARSGSQLRPSGPPGRLLGCQLHRSIEINQCAVGISKGGSHDPTHAIAPLVVRLELDELGEYFDCLVEDV